MRLTYWDFKDLNRRTAVDKVLHDKAFNIADKLLCDKAFNIAKNSKVR